MASEQTINDVATHVSDVMEGFAVDPATGMAVIKNLNDSGKELRIWVDTANAFGHHTTTINILKWIVGYGFSGTIRVFCDTANAKKLEMLLPGYRWQMQKLPYQAATLVFHYGTKRPKDRAPLLICGGSEAGLPELKGRLAKAQCDYYLQLQPWHWGSLNRLIYGSDSVQDVVELNNQVTLGGLEFDFCAYTEPAPTRDDAVWDLYGNWNKSPFTETVKMAKRLADFTANAYFMPTYGMGTKSSTFAAALTAILGSVQAIDLMPQHKIPVQPIVILIFDGELGQPWSALQGWLDGTSEDSSYPAQLKKFVTDNEIEKRFGICADRTDKALEYVLDRLPGNGVLAVWMPGTPNEIFRYFYGAATLPFVFEGRGTQSLALNLGRPYLCTNSTGYPSKYFNASTPSGAQPAMQTVAALTKGTSSYKVDDSDQFPSSQYAANLCKLLTDGDSKLYFSDLAAAYRDPPFDKLRRALRFCRSIKGFPL